MFAALLNRYGVVGSSSADGTGMRLEAIPDDLSNLCDKYGGIVDEAFEDFLAHMHGFKAYVAKHPNDSTRYVLHVKYNDKAAFYDKSEGKWFQIT